MGYYKKLFEQMRSDEKDNFGNLIAEKGQEEEFLDEKLMEVMQDKHLDTNKLAQLMLINHTCDQLLSKIDKIFDELMYEMPIEEFCNLINFKDLIKVNSIEDRERYGLDKEND
tara:strand:- start:5476 stop:5814 length:339 start_codon:yes stop_codon:yes gene_type:complete